MITNGEHLSLTAEHYTPAEWVERARLVMGGIDCDPASCAEANKTVRAGVWCGIEQNGLEQEWHGRVFVNPPGDRSGKLPQRFFEKLTTEVQARRVTQFIWLAFNLSQLRTLQNPASIVLLQACDVFVPRSRIRFTGSSPTKDNAFLYWGARRSQFRGVFGSQPGALWRGAGC